MPWWSRNKDREDAPDEDYNLLVISDVHLGEDVLINGPEHMGEYIRALNRELAEFIASHRARRVDGRPWHLLVNGDMFDFVKVSLRPEPEDAYVAWARGEREVESEGGGIPNTAANVTWKLQRILEIHRPLFKELAAFVLDGNRLTIIEGNHDAEFYFDDVRACLRDEVVRLGGRLHREQRRRQAFDEAALAERVQFRSWFDASPGRYHIEHGNQYDEMCSFEWRLAPYDKQGADTLAVPLSHRAMPYFAELLGDFSTHGLENKSFVYWLRYVFSFGPRLMWALFKTYWVVVLELFRRAGGRRRAELLALRGQHDERLRRLSEDAPYGQRILAALDRLKATPAEYSLFKMLRAAYVDRFAVIVLAVLLSIPVFFLTLGKALWWAGAVWVLAALSLWALARTRQVDLPAQLRRAAARIAEITGSRYVVFGHSHHPELVDLRAQFGVGRFGERAFYLNTGSWVTREILLGAQGRGMTYVQITRRGAALRRWLGPQKEPAVLAETDPAPAPSLSGVG
ncbi:MAG: hypothetical protein HYZ27_09460 [Deltaproteobacteria bacterium]|nr:hypothetical protein [Deltaproteobacteria bacterium]